MLTFIMILYPLLFSLLANGLILFKDNLPFLIGGVAVFILLNLTAGLFAPKTKNLRLRALCHGTTLLISFCLSAAVGIAENILLLFGVLDLSSADILVNIIYCIICNYIIFINGIVCVYLTSVQLGIKIRVIGIICGFIPVVNLAVLIIIIKKVYDELLFESKKEKVNRKRQTQQVCKTKYPILFVHGVFFRDNKHLSYWGRIPKELKTNGATCFYGNHQSALSIEDSAGELAERIKEIVESTGCEKVNIIAHSKGGLDCRFAIANCGVADCVASLTTVNTPHRGCLFAEWLMDNAPATIKNTVAGTYNRAARLLGDTEPDFIAAVSNLQEDYCKVFDRHIKTPDGIYCQSIGSVMQKARGGKFPLNLSYNFVKLFDGKNDGLVGVDSFKWGSKYTLIDLPVKRGISHCDMIDLNRENLKGFDVREFYVNLVSELKEMGL